MLASIQISLLSLAATSFIWFIPFQNGGLLNEIFKISTNGTHEFVQLNSASNLSLTILLNLVEEKIFHQNTNSTFLQFFPEKIGGGSKGVQDADDMQNKVPILSGLLVSICVFMSLACMSVITLSCFCGCEHGKSPAFYFSGSSNREEIYCSTTKNDNCKCCHACHRSALLESVHEMSLNRISSSEENSRKFGIYHITLIVLMGIFLLGTISMNFIYFYAAELVMEPFQPISDDSKINSEIYPMSSLFGNINYMHRTLVNFLRMGIETGTVLTERLTSNVRIKINTSMDSGISNAMGTLLEVYGVQNMLDVGNNLQKELEVMQSSMEVIRLSNQQTSAIISSLSGALETIYNLIHPELTHLCTIDLGESLNTRCEKLKVDSKLLKIEFIASEILVDPPAVLNFLLNEFNINLDTLLDQFAKVSEEIVKIQKDIHARVLEFLDFDKYLRPLDAFWRDFDISTNSLISQINSIVTTIGNGVVNAQPWVLLMVYLPAGLFVSVTFIGIIFSVLYLIEAIDYKMFHIVSRSSNTNAKYSTVNKNSNVCNYLGFLLYSIFILTVFISVTLLVIIFMSSSALLATEGCVYLDTSNGTAKTDFLLNKYMTQTWPELLVKLFGNSSVGTFFNLIPPTDIVKAATVACRPKIETPGGLLSAIGWKSIVNVEQLLGDEELLEQIKQGESIMIEEVKKIDIVGLLPKDLETIVTLARNMTGYFDKMDYSSSIEQLNPHKIPVDMFELFENELSSFGKDVVNIGLDFGNIIIRGAQLLEAKLEDIVVASQEAEKLRIAFESVQERRNLTMGIDDLVKGLDETVAIVSDETALLAPIPEVYKTLIETFLSELEKFLKAEVSTITLSLYPCADLFYTTETLLNAICRQNGLLARLFSWSLVLATTMLFTLLFFYNLFHLFFVQSHQFRRIGARNAALNSRTNQIGVNRFPKYEQPIESMRPY